MIPQNNHRLEIAGVADGVQIEQTSTRGDGTIELGEEFARDSIDFSAALDHVRIHTDGPVAGSQFSGDVFPGPEAIAAKIQSSLPETLRYDQHGRAELTLSSKEGIVGYSGIKSVNELEDIPGVHLTRGVRMPDGIPGEEAGKAGAWYPELVRDPVSHKFKPATNPDGSIKNPHGKFEPEANIAIVDPDAMGVATATNRITVIIQEDREHAHPTVLTIFPGDNAPAFPAKIQTDTFHMDTLQGPEAAYWDTHAFIRPAQPAE